MTGVAVVLIEGDSGQVRLAIFTYSFTHRMALRRNFRSSENSSLRPRAAVYDGIATNQQKYDVL